MPERLNPTTHLPMSQVADVFGGEKQTPHAVFSQNRSQIGSGTTHTPRPNDLALECPTCKNGVRLWARDVGVSERNSVYCIGGHNFRDLDAVMALNPRKLEFKGTPAKQDGFLKMTIEMPGSVLEALTKRFGDRLPATLSGIMEVISSGPFIVVGESDIGRITQHVGEKVTSASFLVGKILDYKTTIEEQKQTIERLQNKIATRSGRPSTKADTEITVDLGEELAAKVAEVAKSRDLSTDEIISGVLQQYLVDNNWG